MVTNKISTTIKAILFCICFTALLAITSKTSSFFPLQYERFVYGLTGTIVAFVLTWIFCKTEKITLASIGLIWEKKTAQRIITGFAIGCSIAMVTMGAILLFTSVQIKLLPNYNIASFLFWALALIPLALMEELAFRGYAFVKLNKTLGLVLTQIIIATLFALYHYVGGQSLLSSFIGPGVFALIFGLAAAKTNGIALPTGIHIGVNFMLALLGQHKGMRPILALKMHQILRLPCYKLLKLQATLYKLFYFYL
ncbi:MAG: CPBP family intramembrane metalloprotease [Chitinophagaceae bacterium]|nr:CPBP family intramembrane metalloprotease [Chitinophagaceae bacterium]